MVSVVDRYRVAKARAAFNVETCFNQVSTQKIIIMLNHPLLWIWSDPCFLCLGLCPNLCFVYLQLYSGDTSLLIPGYDDHHRSDKDLSSVLCCNFTLHIIIGANPSQIERTIVTAFPNATEPKIRCFFFPHKI